MADKVASSPVVTASEKSAPAPTTPKKATTDKSNKPRRATVTHPKTAEMVNAAIVALKERGGSSLQAIKKYMVGTYMIDAEKQAKFINKYLNGAVASGALVRTKGKGAAGSFKIGKLETAKPKAKTVPKASAAPKAKVATKSAAAKKPVSPKKPTGAKKTPSKKAAATATAVTPKKKALKGPAAKPPKAKTTKAKPATAKTPVKKSKPTLAKKTKPVAPQPKKVAPKKTVAAKK